MKQTNLVFFLFTLSRIGRIDSNLHFPIRDYYTSCIQLKILALSRDSDILVTVDDPGCKEVVHGHEASYDDEDEDNESS